MAEYRRTSPGRTAMVAAALLGATLAAACSRAPESTVDHEFTEACMLTGNFEREVCECTAEKAAAELAPNSRAFVVASLTNDREEIKRLREELSMQEALEAGKFMARAPGLCQEELQ